MLVRKSVVGEAQAEVVHSLAKWKRLTLAEYEIEPAYGVYTDMLRFVMKNVAIF